MKVTKVLPKIGSYWVQKEVPQTTEVGILGAEHSHLALKDVLHEIYSDENDSPWKAYEDHFFLKVGEILMVVDVVIEKFDHLEDDDYHIRVIAREKVGDTFWISLAEWHHHLRELHL